MKLNPFLFLFVTAAVATLSASSATQSYYRNVFGRTFGDSNIYRWLCESVMPEGVTVAGLVTLPAPQGATDTYGRYVSMVKCHEAARTHFKLNLVCAKDPHKWTRIARREMQRCAHKPLSKAEQVQSGQLSETLFRGTCDARFRARLDGGNSRAVLLCLCDQTQFPVKFPEVPPVISFGRGTFSTLQAPRGRTEIELKAIQSCVENELPGSSNVCSASSQDFSILARHRVEACCKRVRTQFKTSKLDCKKIVPDQLSGLKVLI